MNCSVYEWNTSRQEKKGQTATWTSLENSMLSGKGRHNENKICDPFIGNLRTNKISLWWKNSENGRGNDSKGDVGTFFSDGFGW